MNPDQLFTINDMRHCSKSATPEHSDAIQVGFSGNTKDLWTNSTGAVSPVAVAVDSLSNIVNYYNISTCLLDYSIFSFSAAELIQVKGNNFYNSVVRFV